MDVFSGGSECQFESSRLDRTGEEVVTMGAGGTNGCGGRGHRRLCYESELLKVGVHGL